MKLSDDFLAYLQSVPVVFFDIAVVLHLVVFKPKVTASQYTRLILGGRRRRRQKSLKCK